MDGLLSQEEINALFSSNLDDDAESTSYSDLLSPEEKDAIGEISNISMGTSATTLSALLSLRAMSTWWVPVPLSMDVMVLTFPPPCCIMLGPILKAWSGMTGMVQPYSVGAFAT